MNKVLVTGGLGYIGSHTVVELIQAGYEVVIIDDLSNSRIEVLDGIETITRVRPVFYKINLIDPVSLRKVFKEHAPFSNVIHFAASKAVEESVREPLMYYRNNISTLINLLEAMREADINNMVFSSSCTVYGQPDHLPVTESSPFRQAESPYGSTKQMAEEILRNVCKNSDLRAISLRYFNPVGAHESATIGELPLGKPANLMPILTQVAAGKIASLQIYGQDYNTADGTAVRDYIHVTDLANAHVFACSRLEQQKQKKPYEYFNVGTGNGISVLQMVKAFEKINGLKLPYQLADRRQGDIEKIYASTSLAEKELGWKATRTLEDMVRSAWKWQQTLLSEYSEQ